MDRGKIAAGEHYLLADGTEWARNPDRWRRVVVVDVGPFVESNRLYADENLITLADGTTCRRDRWVRDGEDPAAVRKPKRYGVAVRHVDMATGTPADRAYTEIVFLVDVRATWANHVKAAGPEVLALVEQRAKRAETLRLAVLAGVANSVTESKYLRWENDGRGDLVAVRRGVLDELLRLAAQAGWGRV